MDRCICFLKVKSKTYGTKFILFDKSDRDLISKYTWSVRKQGKTLYAHSWIKDRKKLMGMQYLLLEPKKGLEIDHVNRNGLDNRRCNLRHAFHNQNCFNFGPFNKKGKTSKYKGVCWYKPIGKWLSHIHLKGKTYHVGCFTNEKEAAKAYNQKASELFGEFAYLNPV